MEMDKPVSHRILLEKGSAVFRKILNQPVLVTREEMCDLINFEVSLNLVMAQMKEAEEAQEPSA
jgi:hypothetical protein